MATIDFRSPAPSYQQLQHPHRKPMGAPTRNNDLRPLSKIVPDIDYSNQPQQRNASPYTTYPRQGPQPPHATSPTSQQYPNNILPKSRRTPSQSTTTSSTYLPQRTPSNVSSTLSRNASTRSGASSTPGSYVALMRKQKATVWCDRAQHEDPRLTAQHKAAKIRAAREITGKASAEGRTSTSGSMGSGSLGVRSKIRHHGLPKATGYSYANMVGGGVPMRLSASEVGDEVTEYDEERKTSMNYTRTSTGRNSIDNRHLDIDTKRRNRYSQSNSTPNSTHQAESPSTNIPELEENPLIPTPPNPNPNQHQPSHKNPPPPPTTCRTSGSSSSRENSFGNIGKMEAPRSEEKPRKKIEEDLRRRGSVDERTNTMGYMGQGRLFVANPDLSD